MKKKYILMKKRYTDEEKNILMKKIYTDEENIY